MEEVRAWIERMHAMLTRFDPDSQLSRLNAGAGDWVEVGPELGSLLRLALDAHEVSGGLVHAGVLGAVLATGYTRTLALGPTPATMPPPPPPPLPEILEVGPGRARVAAGAGVDVGGLAKGWLADRAVERIGANALANLGGDLRALGGGPEGEGWPVGFGGTTVLLTDGAAATSGIRGRAFGGGLHHLIDPRTARPAATDLAEVSVLAPTAADAEIWAKTALLLGSREAPRFLEGRSAGWHLVPV